MKEGIIRDAYEKIIHELQTLITIGYIGAVGIGMLFNYHKYEEFGINIFDYADVFDFLIAPFSDLYILLFTIASLFVVYLFFRFDTWQKRKFPNTYSKMNLGMDKKSWWDPLRIFMFLSVFIVYLYLAADFYGEFSSNKIKKRPSIQLRFSDNEIKKGILIGKTREILFLLNNEKVDAVPISSLVKEFEIR